MRVTVSEMMFPTIIVDAAVAALLASVMIRICSASNCVMRFSIAFSRSSMTSSELRTLV